MRRGMRKLTGIVFAAAVMCLTGTAWAVDKDDDLKPDDSEHIGYDASALSPDQASEVESKFPEESKAVREALARHIAHANGRQLEAYLDDFLKERIRYPELERSYAERVMALEGLELTVKAVEFQKLTRTTATIHTRQISKYVDEKGLPRTDDVIISYRWIKDANDGVWRISFTERKRLTE